MGKSSQGMRFSHILALGSGTGFAGLSAAAIFESADVCLTDLEEALDSLLANCDRNPLLKERVRVAKCDWHKPPPDLLQGPFDCIICADCIWLEELVEPFVKALEVATDFNPGATILIAYQSRSTRVDRLLFNLLDTNFKYKKKPMIEDEPDRRRISIYEVVRIG